MGKIIETDEFTEDIYQIEITDDVIGGEDGISNKAAKALANRTLYLKNQVATKAATSGSSLQRFKVSVAEEDNDAVNKKQMMELFSSVQTLPIGYPMLSWEIYDFTIVAFGGEFNRAEYPKLWAKIESNPTILLTESEWQTESASNDDGICGFFSSGDGLTTFRVPSLNEAFFRASNRGVGSFENEQTNSIDSIETSGASLNGAASKIIPEDGTYTEYIRTGSGGTSTYYSIRMKKKGVETRPKNIALLPLIVAK